MLIIVFRIEKPNLASLALPPVAAAMMVQWEAVEDTVEVEAMVVEVTPALVGQADARSSSIMSVSSASL